MQLLTGTSHHFFRYNTITVNWNAIKNSTNTSDVSFAYLAIVNLHYGLFGELLKGFVPLPISNTSEDPIIGIHYGQYGKLVASTRPTSDCDHYKKDALDADENDDEGAAEDEVADNDDDQREDNDQNSDGDSMKE